jgi:transmembrane sensor
MKWLENPQSEADKVLRDGLDSAAQRTGDEITHRRVWAKVADSLLEPKRRFSARLALASASGAVALLAVGALVVYPHVAGRRPSTVVASAPVAAPTPAPQVAPSEMSDTIPERVAVDESERAPGKVVRTRRGERARVALGGGATADLAEDSAITWDTQHRPSVESGSAELSVPHQPPGWRFSLTAGPYVVTVVGTKFKVEMGSRSVGVEVTEGVVEVWRGSRVTRLAAGDAWHGPLHPEEPAAQPGAGASAAPPSERPRASAGGALASRAEAVFTRRAVPISRGLQEARAAVEAGDFNRAVEILARAAQGTGPVAENAAYELAWITRYNLGRPRQAVTLWDKYRNRFPSGVLRAEADLSIVDTLSQLGDVRAALAEAKAFISRHPNSERRAEIQRLVDRLRAVEASSEPR